MGQAWQGLGEAILWACEPEPQACFCKPRKIPAKKSKNGHNALIWYLYMQAQLLEETTSNQTVTRFYSFSEFLT